MAEIFSRLAADGYAVTLACSSFPGGAEREEVQGLDVRRLGGLARYYPSIPRFVRRSTGREFDVVVECLNKVPFFSPLYSKVPVLALCHHLFGETAFEQVAWPIAATVWSAEKLIPTFYRGCQFVTISESSRDDLVVRGVAAECIMVSHCGIQRPTIEPDMEHPRPPRVVYLGRIEPYKNVDVVLRVMARLSDRFPDAEILIIGRGSAQESLEQLAGELGIADRVRFTGFVTDGERDEMLAGSRVCICASTKEGWGLTVIEANALGTPVVATDAPGLRDSVRDGETGFLAGLGDLDGFEKRVEALLSDDALAGRMSKAALDWSKRFDWDLAAKEMAEALELARGRS